MVAGLVVEVVVRTRDILVAQKEDTYELVGSDTMNKHTQEWFKACVPRRGYDLSYIDSIGTIVFTNDRIVNI